MINNEIKIKNIYRRSYYHNLACAGVMLLIVAILGVFMMTLGNTNYSLSEVIKVLSNPASMRSGAASWTSSRSPTRCPSG